MRFQIPIDTLFTQVFGISGALIRKYNDNGLLEEGWDSDCIKTNMGTVHQFPMVFGAGNYRIMNNGIIESTWRDAAYLPYTSVAGFSRAKRITETFMSGYKGSVIEQYGFEPWHIRIQGFIIKENNQRRQSVADQVKEMQSFEELSDAIEVKGKVFEWLGIHQAAIMSINYPEARDLDMSVVKPYEIVLKSVEPYELLITNY